MRNKKLKLGLFIFSLGFIGVLSLLSYGALGNTPEEMRASIHDVPEIILKLFVLIAPSFLLLVFTIIGVFTYEKAHLQLPLIENLLFKKELSYSISVHIIHGIISGIVAAAMVLTVSFIFEPYIEDIFNKSGNIEEPPMVIKLLYGGLTEEVMLRFGLMSLIVYILIKVFNKRTTGIYILGIAISSLLFAVGHFPSVYVFNPKPSCVLLIFILLANTVVGFLFGWLYWRKSLSSAMIAHMFFHVTMFIIVGFI